MQTELSHMQNENAHTVSAILPTEESLPILGCGLYKNLLVVKTEDNCDKNKDIILK